MSSHSFLETSIWSTVFQGITPTLTVTYVPGLSVTDVSGPHPRSLFEIALKTKRGQLNLAPFTSAKDYWEEAIQAYHCVSLAVQAEDFDNAVQLPDHHIDPFDRIIIAQAIRTKSEIVTYDDRFSDYSVTLHD